MHRLFGLSIAALLLAGATACGSSISSPLTTTALVPVAAARGAVLSLTRVGTITKAQMSAGLVGSVISQLGGPPQCSVTLYAVRYATIGTRGEPADASAAFFVPGRGCTGPFPLVGYAQGTNAIKAQKITDPTPRNIEPVVIAAIYAAHGDAVAATDYLGLGYSSYPFQPYLVVNSEASAVIDSMRAIRNAATRLNVPLSSTVLLTGHSQGGQAAMATQRAIEADEPSEFHLIAGAPSSGPYALTMTTLHGLAHPGLGAVLYSAYMITAFHKTYANVYTQASEIFKQPYAGWIDSLLPVKTYAQARQLDGTTLPLTVKALLRPAFLNEFANDPKSEARIDIAKNDLLRGWKPVAPLALCGGSHDPEVTFENARRAYGYFKQQGANVSLTDVNSLIPPPPTVPVTLYHDAVLVFCLTLNRVAILDAPATRAHLSARTVAAIARMAAGSPNGFALHP